MNLFDEYLKKFFEKEKNSIYNLKRVDENQKETLISILEKIEEKYRKRKYRTKEEMAKDIIFYLIAKESAKLKSKPLYFKSFLSKISKLPCHTIAILVDLGFSLSNLENFVFDILIKLKEDKRIFILKENGKTTIIINSVI